MNSGSAATGLTLHIALLSLISFGGVPGVLPDLHNFVVNLHPWLSERDFANVFAITQACPGPNMLLLMGFVGWKIGGLPTAIAGALAIFVPSGAACFSVHRLWHRFRDRPWQQIVRRGLAPVTIGLVIAGGFVIAGTADTGWISLAMTLIAIAVMLGTRINPLWLLGAGAAFGAVGLV